MSAKTSADVIIGGKVYTLSGYESEAYLQKVATYINNKISEFEELEEYRRFPTEMKATLLELNLADDYFKAKTLAERLEEDLESKSKALYNLQHELVSVQIKLDALEKVRENMEKENRELLLDKTKLEAALEDALAGKAVSVNKDVSSGKTDARKKDIQPWKVETIKRDGTSSGKKEQKRDIQPKKKDIQPWKAEPIKKEELPGKAVEKEELSGKSVAKEELTEKAETGKE